MRTLVHSANTLQSNAISSTHVYCFMPELTLHRKGLVLVVDPAFEVRNEALQIGPSVERVGGLCSRMCPSHWRNTISDARFMALSWCNGYSPLDGVDDASAWLLNFPAPNSWYSGRFSFSTWARVGLPAPEPITDVPYRTVMPAVVWERDDDGLLYRFSTICRHTI
jgi:hypothetical protein